MVRRMPVATVNETLASVNEMNETLASVKAPVNKTPAGRGQARPGRRRRRIPYIFVAPRDRFVFGRIARRIYKRHYAGVRGAVRDSNLALLGRVLDADRSAIHGELLSYLFLANEFIEELIADASGNFGTVDQRPRLEIGGRFRAVTGTGSASHCAHYATDLRGSKPYGTNK